MDRLIELLQSGDPALKLNALWAVKNLLRKSTTETKRSVMRQLGWDRVVEYVRFPVGRVILILVSRYLKEGAAEIQEQTFNTLRNVAESPEGIDMIFKNIPVEILLNHITVALASSSDDVVLQVSPAQPPYVQLVVTCLDFRLHTYSQI